MVRNYTTKTPELTMKTHTFRLGKYRIHLTGKIEGVCDTPNTDKTLDMIILDGNDFKALNSAIHEAMHAEGIHDKYLHDKDGYSDTDRITRFIWRLGYRKTQ